MTRISTQSSLRSQRLFSLTSPEENSMLKNQFSETPAEERWICMACLPTPGYKSSGRAGRRTTAPKCDVLARGSQRSHIIDKCGERLLRLWPKKGRSSLPKRDLYQTHSERLNVRRKREHWNLLGFLMVLVFVTVLGAGCERRVASASARSAPEVGCTCHSEERAGSG